MSSVSPVPPRAHDRATTRADRVIRSVVPENKELLDPFLTPVHFKDRF